MTVPSKILRCVNNRLRHVDETVRVSNMKKFHSSSSSSSSYALADPHEDDVSIIQVPSKVMTTRPTQPATATTMERNCTWSNETQRRSRSVVLRRNSIFRKSSSSSTRISTTHVKDDEWRDELVLKRANPVYDDDDDDDTVEDDDDTHEEESHQLLIKENLVNQHSIVTNTLHWDDQVLEGVSQRFAIMVNPSNTSSLTQQRRQRQRHVIFRKPTLLSPKTNMDDDQVEDLLVLKRANPVYDDNDDNDDDSNEMNSPWKRTKWSNPMDEDIHHHHHSMVTSLHWDEQLVEDKFQRFTLVV